MSVKPLPSICPHESPYADRGNVMKAGLCQHKATKQGWCNDHAWIAELLVLASKLGYPQFVVVYGTLEPVYTIGPGCANWEAYAVRAEYKHFFDLKKRLMESWLNWQPSRSERRDAVYLDRAV